MFSSSVRGADDEPAYKRYVGASSPVFSSCHVMSAGRELALWVVEFIWAHGTMDLHVIDLSDWPHLDSRPLTLEDSWRLRVASAQASNIVKSRDVENFERVMQFVEATHRLVPTLVTPIKHMKLAFGLKTMVIMWMLRQDAGVVDIVFKIKQFFPNKLPQYEDQCTQREMFLMRRNNLDFRVLTQSLALDKDKCDHYMKTQMDTEYGGRYAQRVEDRLLHYLQQLQLVLPEHTFIDQILKKKSPVTEDEKLLVDIVTSDSVTIATTLRRLLHCDAASCHGGDVSSSLEQRATGAATEESAPFGSSSRVSKDGLSLRENSDNSDVQRHQPAEEGGEIIHRVEEKSGRKRASPPQFCSKHQRWVKNMLQECPDECSQEPRANVSSSPPLFQSSSSTSSSQDLTPSGLILCPTEQQNPPPQMMAAPGQENPNDEQRAPSTSQTSPTESPPQPSSTEALLPSLSLLSPVVRLIDIASIRWSCPHFKPQQASSNPSIVSRNKQAASISGPQTTPSPCCPTSRSKDSSLDRFESAAPTSPPNPTNNLQTAPVAQEASTDPTPPRKHRRTLAAVRHAQTLETTRPPSSNLSISCPSVKFKALSSACNQIRSSLRSSRKVVLENSSTSSSDRIAVRSEICRVRARLSLLTQTLLLQSSLLQPYVSLTRLNAQGCSQATEPRSSDQHEEELVSEGINEEERSQEDNLDSSFDVNSLYSGHSSSSDGEDCDPDYKPSMRKKRLLLSTGHTSPTAI
ncbi:uncharacterized protein LOC131469781 isoform X1 [Solea solea]|uniref:uncharacterized protein LOC131469781 isoform X1 n=2 Tax=Solea solea TaxID=90069 RepID=UPI00272CBEF0|nr:uncharacterized protein LOC131469781 isoform X1 [Solea solea]